MNVNSATNSTNQLVLIMVTNCLAVRCQLLLQYSNIWSHGSDGWLDAAKAQVRSPAEVCGAQNLTVTGF